MRKRTVILLLLLTVCFAGIFTCLRVWGPDWPDQETQEQEPNGRQTQDWGLRQEKEPEQQLICSEETYGYSGLNTPLQFYRLGNPESKKKILCVFAMHGFEDAFYRDGQALVDTAYKVIAHLREDPASLDHVEVMVVPCANPDGLAEGWTCNGPGRCQISQGIDINMDFDYNFRVRTNTRNKTDNQPFTSPEAAALRDLILQEKPDMIIDFHGWVNSASGDQEIAKIFCKYLNLAYEDKEKTFYDGFFVGWAGRYARSVLVEYPDPLTGQGVCAGKSDREYDYAHSGFNQFGYAEKTAAAIREIAAEQTAGLEDKPMASHETRKTR
ncbi:MAG: hypothetical protein APF84_09160 [Gracilibacter sp. BRH_c7a]|nr:MAG: hypothetical protein APF84_09160 [Gracilibacter sp. BRH_c7a]